MSKIICDEKFCSGCLACVVACMDQHYEETEADAVSPRIYEKHISEQTGLVNYITRSCLHCTDAKCMEVCPVNVFERLDGGFVVAVGKDNCIGCRQCAESCPHDVPRFDIEGRIVKCDGCATRVAYGLEPACVRACNTGALTMSE